MQDDGFAQQLYQSTRRLFAQNLKEAVEARDAWFTEKVSAGVILGGVIHLAHCT